VRKCGNFLHILTVVDRPTLFTMETESTNSLSRLHVLVSGGGKALLTKGQQEAHTHTDCHLHFNSNHPLHVYREVVHGLINTARTICLEKQCSDEVMKSRKNMAPNGHPQYSNDYRKKTRYQEPSSNRWANRSTVVVPYVKRTSRKFRRTAHRCNMKTAFKTRHDNKNYTKYRSSG
jgi:hypothetical protein